MSPKHAASGWGLVVEEEQVDPAESAKRVMEFAKALLEVAKQFFTKDACTVSVLSALQHAQCSGASTTHADWMLNAI
eukprot:1138583-Pelagomonas_calceolata.AAC.6